MFAGFRVSRLGFKVNVWVLTGFRVSRFGMCLLLQGFIRVP